MLFNFRNVRFLKSAGDATGAPKAHYPQIAVFGRSNVGKSSLLNDLFQRKGFVKTSSLPGKTQLLNFFLIEEKLLCVDLPGYGYAKVGQGTKKKWAAALESYLNHSKPSLALFLLDIRRDPSELDMQMGRWLEAQEIPTVLILTKVDKVSKSERVANTKKILDLFNWSHVHYSTTKREGRQQLIALINHAIAEKEPVHLP